MYYPKLNEDPDYSTALNRNKPMIPRKGLIWNKNAWPFGWNDQRQELAIGKFEKSHGTVGRDSGFAYLSVEGRIWPAHKVIAFWEAPTKEVMINILVQLVTDPIFLDFGFETEMEKFIFDIPNPDQDSPKSHEFFSYNDYPEDPKNWMPVDFKRPEHTVSPLKKTKQKSNITTMTGKKIDKRNAWERGKPFEGIEEDFYPSLNESPDHVCATPGATPGATGRYIDSWTCAVEKDAVAHYNDREAMGFGIWELTKDENYIEDPKKVNGTMFISRPSGIHRGDRANFKYAGRIWTQKKIISFWEAPPPNEIEKFLVQLGTKMHHEGYQVGNLAPLTKKRILDYMSTFLIEIIEDGGDGDEKSKRSVWQTDGAWRNWDEDVLDDEANLFHTKLVTVAQYKNLTSVTQLSKANTIGDHEKSPNDPTKKKRSSGLTPKTGKKIDDRNAREREKPFESMEEDFYPTLNENPNAVMNPIAWERHKDNPNYTPTRTTGFKTEIGYHDDEGNIPFGFYGPDKIFIKGGASNTHPNLYKKATKLLKGDIIKKLGTEVSWKQMFNYLGGERGWCSGRAFPAFKTLSFWKFPKDHAELMVVVNALNADTKLNIDDSWLIEIPSGEFKQAMESGTGSWGSWKVRAGHQKFESIVDYKGGHKRSEEEMGIEHAKSPNDPTKKKRPSGLTPKTGKKIDDRNAREREKPFESLTEAEVGDIAIADPEAYIAGMSKGVGDKIDFISKIKPDCIIDFGCADGYIMNNIKQKYPDIKGFIGYDLDDKMIQMVQSKFPDIKATDNWKEALYLATEYDDIALTLMSVIHEVYSYSDPQTIHKFWKQQVFNPKFKYVVIRDMMPAKEYWQTPVSKEDIAKLKKKIWMQRKYKRSFEKVWGKITANMGNLLHWLLKYDYKSNWSREVNENYFPVSIETIKSKIPSGWKIMYEDHYVFKPIADKVRKDFGIEITLPTHAKMIIVNENLSETYYPELK